jgi:CRISPR-associated protein Csm1
MSVQILLQGKLTGIEEFLLAAQPPEPLFIGRVRWVSLLSEVLPRALIAELGLSKMLLGSSGGEQFLIVLPAEVRPRAEEFLKAARAGIRALSEQHVDLLWAATENLGDWTVVRKRLNEEFQRKQGTPLGATGFESIASVTPHGSEATASGPTADAAYFEELGARLRDANQIGWSPESPARISISEGKHSWPIGSSPDSVPLARHGALTDDGRYPATAPILAQRAEGRPAWGVLRGDVDGFGVRMRRLHDVEEHVQLSVLYKQFFAGEVEVLCSLPEFWRKVNLLHTGGDDFSVYGAWDALIGFARELQRLFHRFTEEHLKDFPGPEGKTITMALGLASDLDAHLGSVYESAGDRLRIAKAADKDCFYLFGRTLEWKQLADAAELRDELAGMVQEFGVAPQYIRDLCGIYRETKRPAGAKRPERPWRFHRRLLRIIGSSRSRDFQKARTRLIADLVGKNPANLKLRPSGRVALEWARLSMERAAEN